MREVITTQLWSSNAFEARNVRRVLDLGIGAVIDLAIEEPPAIFPRDVVYCRLPLLDGPDNPPDRIELAVGVIVQLVAGGTPTLVVCSGGMSRSPAIAAAAHSRLKGISPDDALKRIAAAGPCDVSPGLWRDVRIAATRL